MAKISFIIIMALLLGGCSQTETITLPQLTENTYVTEQTGEESAEQTQQTVQAMQQEQTWSEAESETAAATVEEETEEEMQPEELPDIYYAYHTLDQTSQILYTQIWHALEQMEGETAVSTMDGDAMERIFQCVMADHPELFYVEGYQYTTYKLGGKATRLTFTGTYSMTAEEMQQSREQIEAAAAFMQSAVLGVTDQYEIVKGLYEALIMSTEYDSGAENNQNISSVFLQGRSVCQGYAKAMQYLLQQQGIQALLVTGTADGEGHAWNLVRVDGDYYYLDATWGDASYSAKDENTDISTLPPVSYEYFLVTTAELTCTHQPDTVMTLPDCTATRDNYYIREGHYLNGYQEETLKLIFQDITINNNRYTTMKCSDEATYEQVLNRLVEEHEIFNFLNPEEVSVAYTTNQSLLIITFWI